MTKQKILALADDLAAAFLYYDRKEDDDMPMGQIEKAIKDGTVTVDEICDSFRGELEANI